MFVLTGISVEVGVGGGLGQECDQLLTTLLMFETIGIPVYGVCWGPDCD